MRFAYFFALLTVLFACSGGDQVESGQRIATFQIEGMVCEMGCGASLRKGLYETDAVEEVEVDYVEERQENFIHVHYDGSKTSADKMKGIIEGLNDGQFTCRLEEDKPAPSSTLNEKETSFDSSRSDKGLEASSETFQFPNLTELLNSLIY